MAIRVGQKKPKTIQSEEIGAVRKKKRELAKKNSQVLTKEQRKKLYDTIMQLPKDKQIKGLRDVGLEEEADLLMKQRAEEKMRENQADWRKKRLQEINALPLEDQLSVLLEEGFEEEAKELSERLAAAQKENEEKGGGDDNGTVEEPNPDAPDTTETADNGGDGFGDGAGAGAPADAPDAGPEKEGEKTKKGGSQKKSDK